MLAVFGQIDGRHDVAQVLDPLIDCIFPLLLHLVVLLGLRVVHFTGRRRLLAVRRTGRTVVAIVVIIASAVRAIVTI